MQPGVGFWPLGSKAATLSLLIKIYLFIGLEGGAKGEKKK